MHLYSNTNTFFPFYRSFSLEKNTQRMQKPNIHRKTNTDISSLYVHFKIDKVQKYAI